jgi:hypothetical protein
MRMKQVIGEIIQIRWGSAFLLGGKTISEMAEIFWI